MIFGQASACGSIDAMLSAVRLGKGGALLLTGPAGIGKTTLLGYVAERSAGLQVVRARGTPAEAGIPWAGLSQVLTPLLEDSLPSLAPPQAAALRAALTIGPPVGPDAFAVHTGTLSLLAASAMAAPLVLIIDDIQWLDTESVNALLFAQRRLTHDRVLFMMSARLEDVAPEEWAGLPTIELTGLDVESATALTAHRGILVNQTVLSWLVQATGGNPLAILDLPTYVQPTELAVLALRSDPAPVRPALTKAYGQAVSLLSMKPKRALLIAAMLDGASPAIVERALRAAGISMTALEPAEDIDLLKLGSGVVTMRHPLTRSAVLQLATPSERRLAHRAAAEGLLGSGRKTDAESRIWHLADATVGTDESVAELLEAQARAAAARAGYAAACSINQRAADLGNSGDARTRRLLAAGEAALAAGLPRESAKLLELLQLEGTTSPVHMAAIGHLDGRLRSAAGDPPGAALQLKQQAEIIRYSNPDLAIQMLLDGAFAAVLSGQMSLADDAARMVVSIGLELGSAAITLGELVLGIVQAMSGAGTDALDLLDRCRKAFDVPDPPVETLQQIVYLGTGYIMINAFDDAIPLLDHAIAVARQRGAAGVLPFALAMSATARYRIGDWAAGYADASEAATLALATGQLPIHPNALVMVAQIDAARGLERARDDALTVIREASAMGARFVEAQGFSMLGLLELSIGDPAAAIAPLEQCGRLSSEFGLFELGHLQWTAELIEAMVRCGRAQSAIPTLQIMRGAAHPGSTTLDQAVLARCEGMLSTDPTWDRHFRAALDLHAGPDSRPFELARTRLCFGERLRRNRRRKQAREQLAEAWEVFAALGAETWAQRAFQEIAAMGGTVPNPISHATDLLTPQEFQVAMTIAGGATNREAANALFLSQKTIEFHLSSIYRRLGLRSRADLADALADRLRPTRAEPPREPRRDGS